MVYLALRDEERPAQKHEIANAEDISADYVAQILMKLKTAGLVRSHRGVKGGFSLSRNPHTISVADIITATEGPLSLVPCGDEGCSRVCSCVTRPVWEKATSAIQRIFSHTKVADLAAQARVLRSSKSLTFEI